VPTIEPPRDVAHLLFDIVRLLGRRLHGRFAAAGLHPGQAFLLHRLLRGDGVAQSELARDLHVRAPTVTRILRRMEAAGWVERRTDEGDHRLSRVFITGKSRALGADLARTFAEVERELLAELTPQERDAAARLLLRLHRRALALHRDVSAPHGGEEAPR